jgi:hypothetical protein
MKLVWEFLVDVTDDRMRNTFIAQTNITWDNFTEKVYQCVDKPHDDVCIGYRISGDPCAMIYLNCEYEWNTALRRMREWVLAARTRAVSLEVKNMVSSGSLHRREGTHYGLAGAREHAEGTWETEGKAHL